MADKIKVLLVDDNKELCNIMSEKIDGKHGIEVVGTAGDGVTAISMIGRLEPDIVLLDLIMPNLDGLGVLEWAISGNAPKKPSFIVFSAIGGDIVIQRAMELGADYYMMKPVDADVLLKRILQIFDDKEAGTYPAGISVSPARGVSAAGRIEQIVTDLIQAMGVTPNLAGYVYMREAVLMAVKEPERLDSVSRSIYSELAQKYNTDTRNIDRAIRCAIESSHKKAKDTDNPVRNAYMALSGKKRPNNAAVISFLADLAMQRQRS